MEQLQSHKTIYLAVMIFVLVVFGLLIMVLSSGMKKESAAQKQEQVQTVVQTVSPTNVPEVYKASLSLQKDDQGVISSNKPFDIIITASGDTSPIVGYDVLVTYDRVNLEVVSSTSVNKDFSIFPFKRPTHMVLTGAKKLDAQDPTVFSQTPLVKMSFKPKKAGKYTVSVPSNVGRETTKLVNDKAQILNIKSQSIEIEVE